MRNPNRKLTADELEMACIVFYNHYGLDAVDNAEDLAKEISEQFDCNCTQNEVHKYFRERTVDEADTYLTFQHTQ